MKELPVSVIGKYIHDLNGLIGHVRAEIKVLQFVEADLLNENKNLATALENIESDAENALFLIAQLRSDLIESESGTSVEPVSISPMLYQFIESRARPPSVSVEVDIEEGLPMVFATQHLLEVFRNLCTNAYEAMPDGGKLHISARANQDEGKVEIVFADTGRGMPSYTVGSLFQPYFSTKKQEGHGLGLWWSRVYLSSIGGHIELLWSEVGKGSSFVVTLPFTQEHSEAKLSDSK